MHGSSNTNTEYRGSVNTLYSLRQWMLGNGESKGGLEKHECNNTIKYSIKQGIA